MARILIVDDTPEVLQIIRGVLEAAGHEVDEDKNGRAAVERLGRQQYDLLLTDVLMPDMDGTEVVRAATRLNEAMPIIAISGGGHELPGAVALALTESLGAHRTLYKPFREAELMAAVNELLAAKRR